MLSVPKCLAESLVYTVHLINLGVGNWPFMWDPKTVEAIEADRAYRIEKTMKELGYSSKYSSEDGLRETVDWYTQDGIVQ